MTLRPSARGLRGHTGTSTVPAGRVHTYDLLSDEAFERTAYYRAFDRFTCPTCKQPPGDPCRTRSGGLFKAERNHKTRDALLWSQPCPDCAAEAGQFCRGLEKGVNHPARDELIHSLTPGSEYSGPPKPPAPAGTAAAAIQRLKKLQREGRAPWQQKEPRK